MKVINLVQPYATLIFLGCKNFETRSWTTKHRGPLAIAASAGKDAWAKKVALNDPHVRAALEAAGLTWDSLPRGVVLGSVNVTSMHSITPELVATLTEMERAAGDYSFPGRWAWGLSDVSPLAEPVEYKGQLGIRELPQAVLEACYGRVPAFEYLTLGEPLPLVTPCPSGRNDCPSGCDKCPAPPSPTKTETEKPSPQL